ncbi:MAG: T9SS type A sorting domain-containing protein [Ferruginibacter sp.]
MSTTMAGLGFTYNNVNECSGSVSFTAGGQNFDRRAAGSIDGGSITISTAWTDIFTVTLWTLGSTLPEGGYVVINSGLGATNVPPGIVFPSYGVSDIAATDFPVNSLTYTSPLPLGGTVPVSFTKSSVSCSPSGASILWGTASESNTNYFEVLKSVDGGNNWVAIDRKAAAGNSASDRNYQSLDLEAGAALYKIRQVDRDGRSTETAVMRSACEAKNLITSVLYPVPAKNNMTLAVTANKMIKTTLQIVDAKGRLMQSMEVTVTKGNNNIPFNVSRLAAGEYLLISSNPELTLNKKFVVAR